MLIVQLYSVCTFTEAETALLHCFHHRHLKYNTHHIVVSVLSSQVQRDLSVLWCSVNRSSSSQQHQYRVCLSLPGSVVERSHSYNRTAARYDFGWKTNPNFNTMPILESWVSTYTWDRSDTDIWYNLILTVTLDELLLFSYADLYRQDLGTLYDMSYLTLIIPTPRSSDQLSWLRFNSIPLLPSYSLLKT